MKKLLILLFLCISSVFGYAYEFNNGAFIGGSADVMANYIWRGQYIGGLSFQPDVNFGYSNSNHNIVVDAWFNLGMDGYYTPINFYPELDLSLEYNYKNMYTIGVTHYYYFDGSKFFDYSNTVENSTQTAIYAKIVAHEKYPFTIFWSTYVGGNDGARELEDESIVDEGENGRKYSSYLELSYPIELPLEFELTPHLGMTFWNSTYTNYEGKFAINNLHIECTKTLSLKDIDLYALGSIMFNFYDINNFEYRKNFMWNIGVGFEF